MRKKMLWASVAAVSGRLVLDPEAGKAHEREPVVNSGIVIPVAQGFRGKRRASIGHCGRLRKSANSWRIPQVAAIEGGGYRPVGS